MMRSGCRLKQLPSASKHGWQPERVGRQGRRGALDLRALGSSFWTAVNDQKYKSRKTVQCAAFAASSPGLQTRIEFHFDVWTLQRFMLAVTIYFREIVVVDCMLF